MRRSRPRIAGDCLIINMIINNYINYNWRCAAPVPASAGGGERGPPTADTARRLPMRTREAARAPPPPPVLDTGLIYGPEKPTCGPDAAAAAAVRTLAVAAAAAVRTLAVARAAC